MAKKIPDDRAGKIQLIKDLLSGKTTPEEFQPVIFQCWKNDPDDPNYLICTHPETDPPKRELKTVIENSPGYFTLDLTK